MEIRNLVEKMVFSIVDNPAAVQIKEETTEKGTMYEVSVAKEDIGKLIGKEGRVATALRTITKAAGAKNGIRVSVNIMKDPYNA